MITDALRKMLLNPDSECGFSGSESDRDKLAGLLMDVGLMGLRKKQAEDTLQNCEEALAREEAKWFEEIDGVVTSTDTAGYLGVNTNARAGFPIGSKVRVRKVKE